MKTRLGLIGAATIGAALLRAQTPAPQTTPAPVPRTGVEGRALEFDFPSIEIGVAEYDEGPTGATVFYFPKGVVATVDVRGGAPATVNTDALRLSYPSAFVDAISFAGGSSYGLAAATGVADGIKTERAGSGAWGNIATVAGAIIFDLGGRRFNTVTPDYDLGRAALRARRRNSFPLGNRGAGRFTTQGGYFGDSLRQNSGQGGAFRQVGTTKIAVFTVVNALGTVVDRRGRIVRCGRATVTGCGTIAERIARKVATVGSPARAERGSSDSVPGVPTESTTLTLVVTNQKLAYWALQRLAVQVHASLARALQPFNTENDGDVLFAVSTDEVDNQSLSEPDLGLIASEVAWDAVLSSVPEALPPRSITRANVDAGTLDQYSGEYSLSPAVRVQVRREGTRLLIQGAEQVGIYLRKGVPSELISTSSADFVIDNPRGDRLRFDRDASGAVTGFTINSGTWPVAATRIR
ncbi:MAG: P1 family peptidase [Gemmatimonadota bacterium]|nr:P1 family peptidase [Gemmatimonadota bacterium]